ncbi:MAG TPA: GDSL-type esterase/lipase family protein, partial [Urbifossiella sp.]|nr:GDSL-type esterase/lipase family protein [Urbifossiella sp.]
MPPRRPALGCEALEPRDLPAAAFETLPVIPAVDPATADTVRAIVARGELTGRNPLAFITAGDSNSADAGGFTSGFLTGLGSPTYNPVASGLTAVGPGLVDTLNVYRATGSFTRPNPATYPGFRASDVLAYLPGEIAASNAGLALVMIGTNDLFAQTDPQLYTEELDDIVQMLEAAGIVPILSTIPPNVYASGAYSNQVLVLNQVIADVAGQFGLPVWNLWAGLGALPNGGLGADGTHLTYSGDGSNFTPDALASGQNTRNLEALNVLAWFRTEALSAPDIPTLPATWTPLTRGQAVAAEGRGEGQAPVVTVLDASGNPIDRFLAFDTSFTGGVRVATADVTGDGIPDVIVGAGLGGAPVVRVFSGADGTLVASFFAFESTARGGVNVAAADLDGDGVADIVVGAGDGGGPAVAVYHGGDFGEISRFFAYEPSFRGGVNVAAGNVAGVGPAIVTGAGAGGGPVVKVFSLGDPTPVLSYLAYEQSVRSGVVVAVVDPTGTGGDVATAPAAGAPHVYVVDLATNTVRASFFAPVTGGSGGVRLGVLRGGTGPDELLIGNGPWATVQPYTYDGTSTS